MAWSQQADPTQWASAYYGYGYDPYAYGAAQDPSLYSYGATYPGYGQYPQQARFSSCYFFFLKTILFIFYIVHLSTNIYLIQYLSISL